MLEALDELVIIIDPSLRVEHVRHSPLSPYLPLSDINMGESILSALSALPALLAKPLEQALLAPNDDALIATRGLYLAGHHIRLRRLHPPPLQEHQFLTLMPHTATQDSELLQKYCLEAQESDRAKSEFLTHMSHELRTPLTAIIGFSQLIEMEASLPGSVFDNLTEIKNGGLHLLALVNQLLDLGKIEAGTLERIPEPTLWHPILLESIELTLPLQQRYQVTIEPPTISADIPDQIQADPVRLKQIFINLLSNGCKYNHEGGTVGISISPTEYRDSKIALLFQIHNSGRGIPADRRDELFQPFHRLGVKGIQGAGIGLAITRHLVEVMKGEIGYRSEPETDTTFWFTLPLSSTSQPTQVAPIDANGDGAQQLPTDGSAAPRPGSAPYKILYVEDNPTNMRLVSRLLSNQKGVIFFAAETGHEGVRLAQKHTPDLILLDINLPDIDGYEVKERLAKNEITTHIPVITVSANAMQEDIEKSRKAGMIDYITKPIDVTRFMGIIQQQIDLRYQNSST